MGDQFSRFEYVLIQMVHTIHVYVSIFYAPQVVGLGSA